MKDPALSLAEMIRSSLSPTLSVALLALALVSGCDRKPSGEAAGQAEGSSDGDQPRDPVTGLTEVESKEVLATVGDRTITLGQYAQSLARMDRFERFRYQSEERQLQLLQEMIEVEVLAQEARRRGLDRDPEVKLRLMQALRNEVLEDLERNLPGPESIPESEIRKYYDEHRSDFIEPERRRVLVITVNSAARAAEVIERASGADGKTWAELARKFSTTRDRLGAKDANELAGDLGFLAKTPSTGDSTEDVPQAVRQALFTLDAVGDVYPQPVEAAGLHYVVKLGGMSPGRERTFRDAEPAVRAELQRRRFADAEARLLEELEQRYPAKIDEAALEKVARDSGQ